MLPARAMHVEELGQQKSEGRLAAHWTYDESPHVESRLKSSSADIDVRDRPHTESWMARADVKEGIMRRAAASALNGTGLRVVLIEILLVPFILCFAVVGFELCLCWLWLKAGA